jgi:hypothetical protein
MTALTPTLGAQRAQRALQGLRAAGGAGAGGQPAEGVAGQRQPLLLAIVIHHPRPLVVPVQRRQRALQRKDVGV